MNHYEVLECDSNASTLELKRAYQSLVLKHHPDKSSLHDSDSSDRFLAIAQAWKILSDPASRKKYDAELIAKESQNTPIIYAYVNINEIEYNEESEIYSYPCRCGGTYVIEKYFINTEDFHVNCDECSFSIFVKLG